MDAGGLIRNLKVIASACKSVSCVHLRRLRAVIASKQRPGVPCSNTGCYSYFLCSICRIASTLKTVNADIRSSGIPSSANRFTRLSKVSPISTMFPSKS